MYFFQWLKMKKKCSCYYKYFPQDIITKEWYYGEGCNNLCFFKSAVPFLKLCLIVKLSLFSCNEITVKPV